VVQTDTNEVQRNYIFLIFIFDIVGRQVHINKVEYPFVTPHVDRQRLEGFSFDELEAEVRRYELTSFFTRNIDRLGDELFKKE